MPWADSSLRIRIRLCVGPVSGGGDALTPGYFLAPRFGVRGDITSVRPGAMCTSRCHAPLVNPSAMHPWVSSPGYDEYRLGRKNYGQTSLSPNTTNCPLANGHTHHSQGQRPWNTNPTALLWPTAIVKLQARCRIMPQSLSQLDAHWIFSTRDRFPFPKDHIRERVHSELRDIAA